MQKLEWKCVDCDETQLLSPPKANTQHICLVCGSTLIRLETNSSQPTHDVRLSTLNGINASWDGLFDILGNDFREAIEESMALAAPTRQISTKYLSTLGRVTIDARHTVLYDISVVVGPLTVLGISASFGFLPGDELYDRKFPLQVSGTTLEELSVPQGSMVALSRGVTSFESKSRQALAAGAAALLVFQTFDKWPFIMTADENSCCESPIPILMVSKLHSELISKIAATSSKKSATAVDVKIRIGEKATECSVCQENFSEGEEVYKLPCRHVYHCECVATWLQNNHTCPLCRLQLPRELPSIANTSIPNSDINQVYY